MLVRSASSSPTTILVRSPRSQPPSPSKWAPRRILLRARSGLRRPRDALSRQTLLPARRPHSSLRRQYQVIFPLRQGSIQGHQETTLLQIMCRLLLTEHSQTHHCPIRRSIHPRTQDTTAVLRLSVTVTAIPTLRPQTAPITPRQIILMHAMYLRTGILCTLKKEWSRPITMATPRIGDTCHLLPTARRRTSRCSS